MPCWQCVSRFADQAIQVRVLTSPLPHCVKETEAFNAFEKDYCFRIPLNNPEHLPYIRIIEDEENWALNQNFEDGKNWVLNQNVEDGKNWILYQRHAGSL